MYRACFLFFACLADWLIWLWKGRQSKHRTFLHWLLPSLETPQDTRWLGILSKKTGKSCWRSKLSYCCVVVIYFPKLQNHRTVFTLSWAVDSNCTYAHSVGYFCTFWTFYMSQPIQYFTVNTGILFQGTMPFELKEMLCLWSHAVGHHRGHLSWANCTRDETQVLGTENEALPVCKWVVRNKYSWLLREFFYSSRYLQSDKHLMWHGVELTLLFPTLFSEGCSHTFLYRIKANLKTCYWLWSVILNQLFVCCTFFIEIKVKHVKVEKNI